MYYSNKISTLREIFGTDEVEIEGSHLVVRTRRYPIVKDVILLLDPGQFPPSLQDIADRKDQSHPIQQHEFASDIQATFGAEWQLFSRLLPEHRGEFRKYFDLVDLEALRGARVCDLGCGIGRWSYFLQDRCRELVLVDFSEAIFVARENLRGANHALFFMADLTKLPFRDDFADFLFCLGVLHHLPGSALDEIRTLRKFAPTALFYLYYALDNRPAHFRLLLRLATALRCWLWRIKSERFRAAFSTFGALFFYLPFIVAGRLFEAFGASRFVPLYDSYAGKSLHRIRQDVYDRFFTRIEQRFTRQQILNLRDSYAKVTVSDRWPYWHFLCSR